MPPSSKAKRKADPERKSPRKSKKVKYREETDSDESNGDEYRGKDDFEDELHGLATSNIIQGRRTRGIKVDYTKVDGFAEDEEGEEDESANLANGSRKKKAKESDKTRGSARPVSGTKRKEGGKAATSAKVSKIPKSPAKSIPPKPKRRAVYESDMDEEDDGDIPSVEK